MNISQEIRFRLLLFILLITSSQRGYPDESSYETKRTGFLVITGGFANASAPFLIADTGSQTCLADNEWSASNLVGFDRFRQKFVSVSGATTLEFLRQVPVRVHQLNDTPLDIGIVDFSALSNLVDRRLNGVVGMPYLRDYVLEYSASSGCRLLKDFPKPDPEAIVLPLRNADILPEIEIEIPGIGKRWMILDTGSTGGLTLNLKRINLLTRMGHLSPTNSVDAIDAQGKAVTSKGFVARWVDIGGFKCHNASVDESGIETIGLGLLHHFRMVLDFPRSTAYLYFKGSEKASSPSRNASGMAVNIKRNGRLGVLAIRDGSSAAELGVQIGDEVTAVDGLDPKELGYWEVQHVLGQAGKTIPLTVVRDGKSMEIQMPLRHSFPFPPEWPPEKPEFNPEP